ncbi:MAG: hypothetical protein EXS13_12950 [Planctomycetes bacterium]|nr:hypothetical protein [Planctomycetota bacterium]
MRGRKHPLEIYRDSGRSFLTKPGEKLPSDSVPPQRELRGAYLERVRETNAERAPKRSRASDAGREAPFDPALATKPAPERRSWDATVLPPAKKRLVGGVGALPLARLGGGLAAVLVLFVGVAYALSLWPFASNGAGGDGNPTLKQSSDPSDSFLARWLNPNERSKGRAADEASGVDGDQATKGGATAEAASAQGSARASANVEFWVLAASEKLTDTTRKDWRSRFTTDKQRLQKALGERFPAMRFQACAADVKESEALLRVGPASSEDDPVLKQLLVEVRAVGGGFSKAYIKKFKKS